MVSTKSKVGIVLAVTGIAVTAIRAKRKASARSAAGRPDTFLRVEPAPARR